MENQNVTEMNVEELTNEQRDAIMRLMVEVVFTGFKYIDWGKAMEDMRTNHTPEEFGLNEESFKSICEIFQQDEISDEGPDLLLSDEFYAPVFRQLFNTCIDHEADEHRQEPEKLN